MRFIKNAEVRNQLEYFIRHSKYQTYLASTLSILKSNSTTCGKHYYQLLLSWCEGADLTTLPNAEYKALNNRIASKLHAYLENNTRKYKDE